MIRNARRNGLETSARTFSSTSLAPGIAEAEVPSEPEWFEPPVVAIWPVVSQTRPSNVGWWVISGDVPTDYVSSSEVPDARAAMRVFGRRWLRAAKKMEAGEEPDGMRFGSPNEWKSLAPMLASRGTLLAEWAADDELWQ